MLFFADRGERAVVQGMLIGSVVSVIAALMLLLHGLDDAVPRRRRRAAAGRDGAVAADDRRGAGRGRRPGAAPVRRARASRWRRDDRRRASRPGRARGDVLLAVATVATAWSGYQSTRWNGEQAKAGGRANALRIESAKAAGLANTQTEIDVATFTQWVNAYALQQTELADFYFKRFREEFRPAVDAWVATRPLKNPNAPLTPFAMPQYKLAARAEAERLEAQAEVFAAQVRRGHPARVELRARRRAVRVGAVLRGHEHQADVAEAARRDARDRLRRLPRAPRSGSRPRRSASASENALGSTAAVNEISARRRGS